MNISLCSNSIDSPRPIQTLRNTLGVARILTGCAFRQPYLRRAFNTTEYNRGRLGEAVKAHEEADHGNWYFVQSSKGITSAIIPVNELEELVKAKDHLDHLFDMIAHKVSEERLEDLDELIGFVEAMKQVDVDDAKGRHEGIY